MIQLATGHQWFRYWLGPNQAKSHYLNQQWYRFIISFGVIRPQSYSYPIYNPPYICDIFTKLEIVVIY